MTRMQEALDQLENAKEAERRLKTLLEAEVVYGETSRADLALQAVAALAESTASTRNAVALVLLHLAGE